MRLIIDRFEGDYAVCEQEDRTMLDILKQNIPATAREGDVLIIENQKITIDHEATEKRKKEISALTKDLWK